MTHPRSARPTDRLGFTPLEEVHDAGLDTAAKAFHAQWSADWRHVVLSYRTDRHINALVIYRIAGHRAYLVTGPKLVAVVAPGLPPEILQDNAWRSARSLARTVIWLPPFSPGSALQKARSS